MPTLSFRRRASSRRFASSAKRRGMRHARTNGMLMPPLPPKSHRQPLLAVPVIEVRDDGHRCSLADRQPSSVSLSDDRESSQQCARPLFSTFLAQLSGGSLLPWPAGRPPFSPPPRPSARGPAAQGSSCRAPTKCLISTARISVGIGNCIEEFHDPAQFERDHVGNEKQPNPPGFGG